MEVKCILQARPLPCCCFEKVWAPLASNHENVCWLTDWRNTRVFKLFGGCVFELCTFVRHFHRGTLDILFVDFVYFVRRSFQSENLYATELFSSLFWVVLWLNVHTHRLEINHVASRTSQVSLHWTARCSQVSACVFPAWFPNSSLYWFNFRRQVERWAMTGKPFIGRSLWLIIGRSSPHHDERQHSSNRI